MADTKFAELKTAIRQAELQREIADLPSSPKALRQLVTILSEQGTANLKTDTGFGYLRAITQITKALENVPPRLWGEAIGEIDYVVSFAERDPFMAPDELVTLQSVVASLKREIQRQTGLAIRTGAFLARGVKRMGESLLERGASSSNLLVRMASKLVQAGIERRRTTKEVGKEFARTRSGALGTVSTYRTTPIGFSGDLGGSLSGGLGVTSSTASEPQQLNLPLKIEVEQLSELKKINSTLARQITVAENIDEKNEKQRAIEQSGAEFAASEAKIETPRMALAGPGSSVAQIAAKDGGSGIGSLLVAMGEGLVALFSAPEIITALVGAIAVAAAGGVLTAIGSKIFGNYFGSPKKSSAFRGGRTGGAGTTGDFSSDSTKTPLRIPTDTSDASGGASIDKDTKVSDLSSTQLDALLDAQVEAEGFRPGSVSYRHNNPGNLKYAAWQKEYGGEPGEPAKDGGQFTKFPTLEQGKAAQKALWLKPSYQKLTIDQALNVWSGGRIDNSEGTPEQRAQREGYKKSIIDKVRMTQTSITTLKLNTQKSFSFGSGLNLNAPASPNFTPSRNGNPFATPSSVPSGLGFRGSFDAPHPKTYGIAPSFAPDIIVDTPEGEKTAPILIDRAGTPSSPSFTLPPSVESRIAPTGPAMNRNATPVATASNALAAQGQQVVVMNAPTTAPIVNVQGGGSTVIPMPIRAESIENTLLAMTRLNYV